MSRSKIEICNIALGMLGAKSIRSFDENNKSARLCDRFYESTKLLLLSKFDWPFARKYAKLQPLADQSTPPGQYAFQLPNDCKAPRDIHPMGSSTPWQVYGKTLVTPLSSESVWLYYTTNVTDTNMFTDNFIELLALKLAVMLAPPITQDKELTGVLARQYSVMELEAFSSDANGENIYLHPDSDPENDSFVNPDGAHRSSTYYMFGEEE